MSIGSDARPYIDARSTFSLPPADGSGPQVLEQCGQLPAVERWSTSYPFEIKRDGPGARFAFQRPMSDVAHVTPDLELGFEALSHDEVAAASRRSSTFDVAAVASVAGLRNTQGEIPLDDFVPRRTEAGCPRELDRRAKLLLAHVDGVRTLEQIAKSALLSLPDALTIFFDLLALGLVECDGTT